MTVLVVGASGTTGSHVVEELLAAGVPVRAASRRRETADRLQQRGVEAIAASPEDRTAVRAAVAGVTACYVVTPSNPDMAASEVAWARAAADAGAHLVKLSVIGASADSPLRFGRMHAAAEAAIEATGVSWTFLQPTGFMQNDLAWAHQIPSGTIAGPVMAAAWSIVDVRDIAAVAAAAVTKPEAYAGRRLALTGPEARTPRDRIAALGLILGRDMTAVDVPVDAAVAQLRGFGVTEWEADGLGELFRLYEADRATWVSAVVPEVLGRPARSWEDFATAHAEVLGGADPTPDS